MDGTRGSSLRNLAYFGSPVSHFIIYWWQLYSTVTLRQGEKKHYNHKVDAYSFAIVLWELLHNKLPFEGMSNLQAAYAAAFKVKYTFPVYILSCYIVTYIIA